MDGEKVLKYALIGGGVIIGGIVVFRVLDMMLAPPMTGTDGTLASNPGQLPFQPSGLADVNRAGESTGTALGRVFERAIDRGAGAYETYTREVSQTNRQRESANANNAARDAKLRAAGGR